MEKGETLDLLVPQVLPANRGKLVQVWWGLLVLQVLLVLQGFQEQQVFLEDLTPPQDNRGSQDRLAYLGHQGFRDPLDQM